MTSVLLHTQLISHLVERVSGEKEREPFGNPNFGYARESTLPKERDRHVRRRIPLVFFVPLEKSDISPSHLIDSEQTHEVGRRSHATPDARRGGERKGKVVLVLDSTHLNSELRQGNAADAGGHDESQVVANGQQIRESSGETAGPQKPEGDDGQH